MLSYQHIYHAGNLADVHKHALLAWVLDYMVQKDKPLSYLETHAGRGLYDLSSDAATRTQEAAAGIRVAQGWFAPDHPYRRVLDKITQEHGPDAYPGSPLVAQTILRPADHLHLAELHPQEHAALQANLSAPNTSVHQQNGFDLAFSLCPPDPRRGVMLIDPSYETAQDYERMPGFIKRIRKAWNVGVILLWYPILTSGVHMKMIADIAMAHRDGLRHEVRFPPARDGHRMVGSGLFVINPPHGCQDTCDALRDAFAQASR